MASPLMLRAKDYMKPGTLLDLGAGDGRNGLFFVEQGFDVTLVDKEIGRISPESTSVKVVQADINEYELPDSSFDNVICNFVLHFQTLEQSQTLIAKIKSATTEGGLNVISDFVGLNPGDLHQLYSDWEIVHYETYTTTTYKGAWADAYCIIARKAIS